MTNQTTEKCHLSLYIQQNNEIVLVRVVSLPTPLKYIYVFGLYLNIWLMYHHVLY